MNFKNMFKSTITVPESNETKNVETIETWRVDYYSIHGRFADWWEPKKESQFFDDKNIAIAFKESIENAYKFIGSSGNNAKIGVVALTKNTK